MFGFRICRSRCWRVSNNATNVHEELLGVASISTFALQTSDEGGLAPDAHVTRTRIVSHYIQLCHEDYVVRISRKHNVKNAQARLAVPAQEPSAPPSSLQWSNLSAPLQNAIVKQALARARLNTPR